MPVRLKEFFGDRIQINSLLIVLCFVSVLALGSQSAASYPSYLLAISMLVTFRGWNDVLQTRLFWIICVLIFYLCLSSLWSEPFLWRNVFGIFGRGLLVLLFVVALAECQLRGHVQVWLGRALAVVGAGAAFAAIVVFWIDQPVDGRLAGLGQLDNPVVIGLILSAVCLLLVENLSADASRVWRFGSLVGVLIVGYAIVLSGSRNAWISLGLGLLVLVLAIRVKDRSRFAALTLTLLVLLFAAVVGMLMNDSGRDLLLPRGDSFRLAIWTVVLERVVADGFWFGLGIVTPDSVLVDGQQFSHPHSMYLAILFQGGVVALALFFLLILSVVRGAFADYAQRHAKLALGLMAMALASYILDGHELIDKVGETWFLFWLPIAIALGLEWRHQFSKVSEVE